MLARKKEEARSAASEEARKQAMWEERKRIREEEEKAAASGVKRAAEKVQDAVSVEVDESRWDRLMNGGGKKKKAKKAPALFKGDAAARDAADSRGGGSSKRPGEDSVSVRNARASPAAQSDSDYPPICPADRGDQPDASCLRNGAIEIAVDHPPLYRPRTSVCAVFE